MRSGHRSAHVKAVVLSTVLAAGALAYGWASRAGRPVPEPLFVAGPGAVDTVSEVEMVTHAGVARGEPPRTATIPEKGS